MTNNAWPSPNEMRASFESDEETTAGSDIEAMILSKEGLEHDNDRGLTATTALRRLSRTPCNYSTILRLIKRVAHACIPSFLRASSPLALKPESANSIAALDGLRGLACLLVFNEHLTYNFSTTFLYGYGVDDRRTIVQWPFIRIFWSGFSMVAIFYVISGYVLSYKPLKQMRAKDMHSFQATLTSSVVRRAMRLYLPAIFAVLLCGLLTSLGAFHYSSKVFFHEKNYLGLHELPPPIRENIFLQMADALQHALAMLDFWDWTDDLSAGSYDRHLWTIVVEFRSSMVLFLVLLGVSRLKQAYRLSTGVCLVMFCVITHRKDVLLFVSGMLIAELDLARKSNIGRPYLGSSLRLPNESIIWLTTFVIGLYFLAVPTLGCDQTAGYIWVSSFVPSNWTDKAAFLRSVGAVLVTWSTANSELLKPIFTNKFALYLGKISYALYLVHGNVLKSIGYAVMPSIYRITNDGTKEGLATRGLVVSWLLCAAITVPVTFWLSDVFWRFVDLPCVRFARWVERNISEDFAKTELQEKA